MKEYKGMKYSILQDEYPESPREWDNAGEIVGNCSRYKLCDKENDFGGLFGSEEKDFFAWLQQQYGLVVDGEGYAVAPEELADAQWEELARVVQARFSMLPVYGYIHSGVSLSTAPFSCPWDSGQIGYIYCSQKDGSVDGLKEEVGTFDQYLIGDVYRYTIYGADGDVVDAVYGFYGEEAAEEAAMEYIDRFRERDGSPYVQPELFTNEGLRG